MCNVDRRVHDLTTDPLINSTTIFLRQIRNYNNFQTLDIFGLYTCFSGRNRALVNETNLRLG